MKKFIIGGLSLALTFCMSFTTPAMALTWNTDETSWREDIYLPGVEAWDSCVEIDSLSSVGYVDHDQSGIAATVCYCAEPARVTLLEYTAQSGSVISYASPWDLGSSVVRVSVTDDGEIVKGASVAPTFKNAVDDEDFGECNGAGTYWELDEGIYYMGSADASKMLYLVVGNPFDTTTDDVSSVDTVDVTMFEDVALDAYYYGPVNWAVENNVTSGTSATTFSPNQTCTQAQILTFLWKTAEKPESTIVDNPYTNSNVTEDKYYYKAMLWAWGRGVISNPGLNPDAECKRSDVVSYLWRLSDRPVAKVEVDFVDVPANSDYAEAVKWAVEAKITSGTGADTFSPDASCTRGQIVTFLYHYFVEWENTNVSVSSQAELEALALREDVGKIAKLTAVNAGISDISVLKKMTGLKELEMFFNLDIGSLDALSGLTNLTYLGLSANGISDISALSSLTNLETLDLSGNKITDISALNGLTKLTSLNLNFNSGTTQEQIDILQANLPNCEIKL